MKLINYSIIAPLILPKIAKDAGIEKEQISEYEILFDLENKCSEQRIVFGNSEKKFNGKMKVDKKDMMIKYLLSKVPSDCDKILLQIISSTKEIKISYFKNSELLQTNKY